MPVTLNEHTSAVLTSIKKIADAMNDLHEADNHAVGELFNHYEKGDDWDGDALDETSQIAREATETLFHAANEIGEPLGFQIKFNRLYPRFEVLEMHAQEVEAK